MPYDDNTNVELYILQVNYLNILQLKPCVKYQITVTPIIENNVSGSSANTEATVIAEGTPIVV